jgi:hypothetical protein
MGKFLKVVLILAVAIGIGVAVTQMADQRRRFLAMSEEEQREFIAGKIGDKVPEDKLTEIQDGIIKAVAAKKGGSVSTG